MTTATTATLLQAATPSTAYTPPNPPPPNLTDTQADVNGWIPHAQTSIWKNSAYASTATESLQYIPPTAPLKLNQSYPEGRTEECASINQILRRCRYGNHGLLNYLKKKRLYIAFRDFSNLYCFSMNVPSRVLEKGKCMPGEGGDLSGVAAFFFYMCSEPFTRTVDTE